MSGGDPVDDLTRLVERLSGAVSASRLRQLRWVSGELALYQEWVPAPDLTAMLGSGHVRAYMAAADRGLLRSRGVVGAPSPAGAVRVRRACVVLLAHAARLPAPEVGPAPPWVLREKVAVSAAQRAMSVLTSQAREPGASPGVVRAALVAGLVHHHDLRVGEMANLTMEDVSAEAGQVVVSYRPAAPGVGPGEQVSVVLVAVVAELFGSWLGHREVLVPVPRVRHVLVSVRGNHVGGVRRPAGLPVRPRGLVRAHVGVVERLNEVLFARHGHEPGYVPLPRTLGELRPGGVSVTPEAEDA